MVNLIGDEHLRDDERWLRHCLEGIVGHTRVIDQRGGRQQGKHDLEADLLDRGIAAIEITSEADAARLSVIAAAQRHLSKLEAAGSRFAWLVNITPTGRCAGTPRIWRPGRSSDRDGTAGPCQRVGAVLLPRSVAGSA